MNDYGKKPPQATDLEEAVLSAILLEPESIFDIINILTRPEAFYKDAHQKIYKAILDLHYDSKQIDILTVTEKLKSNQELEQVGGPVYVTKLMSKVATTNHAEYHAKIVFQKYIQREIIRVSSQINQKAYDESIDLQDLLSEYNRLYQQINEYSVQGSNTLHVIEHIKKSTENLEQRQEASINGRPLGIPTGLSKLDEYTNGWQNGDLYVMASRPSMGKSAIMLTSARKAIHGGYKPLIFSLEMSGESLSDRLIIGESDLDSLNYRTGNISDGDWGKIESKLGIFEKSNLYIDDTPFVTIDYIHNVSRVMVKKGLTDYIMIDYLQLIKGIRRKNMNREQEVSLMSRMSKGIARELNIPVILFAQLNREVERAEKKRPQLHHLRESGAIEQDADVVMFLYRPEKYGIEEYEDHSTTRGRGELIVSKFRNGPIGTINFRYNEALTQITDDQDETEPF